MSHGPRPLPLFLDMLRSETVDDPAARTAALAGLATFQDAARPASRRRGRIVARRGDARLRCLGGTPAGRAVVLVPSLINPPYILDLAPGQSLAGFLAAAGHRPYLLDWGSPPPAAARDLTGHVERVLLPMLRRFALPPVLIGYCLGGTLALAAAGVVPVAGLALVAAPWRFAGYGAARPAIAELWAAARPSCEAMGLVPMEVLQTGFWRLDPARTIAKYAAFGRMIPDSDVARRFVALEDWANAGAPLPYAAGRQLMEDFIARDDPGEGRWRVAGGIAAPDRVTAPVVEFVSRTDRIVPAASAADMPDRRDLSLGHVGMVVGGRAEIDLWRPLAEWIAAL